VNEKLGIRKKKGTEGPRKEDSQKKKKWPDLLSRSSGEVNDGPVRPGEPLTRKGLAISCHPAKKVSIEKSRVYHLYFGIGGSSLINARRTFNLGKMERPTLKGGCCLSREERIGRFTRV